MMTGGWESGEKERENYTLLKLYFERKMVNLLILATVFPAFRNNSQRLFYFTLEPAYCDSDWF